MTHHRSRLSKLTKIWVSRVLSSLGVEYDDDTIDLYAQKILPTVEEKIGLSFCEHITTSNYRIKKWLDWAEGREEKVPLEDDEYLQSIDPIVDLLHCIDAGNHELLEIVTEEVGFFVSILEGWAEREGLDEKNIVAAFLYKFREN